MGSAVPSCSMVGPRRILTFSGTSALCSAQTVRSPRRSEVGVILAVLYFPAWNHIFVSQREVALRAMGGGPTGQWYVRSCITIAIRGQHEYPAKRCYRLHCGAIFVCQRSNCGASSKFLPRQSQLKLCAPTFRKKVQSASMVEANALHQSMLPTQM